MTQRILGERGSKKRKRFLFLPVIAVIAFSLFYITSAMAVHDQQFQLRLDDIVRHENGNLLRLHDAVPQDAGLVEREILALAV